ncbi:retromer subunit VPS29 ASCRUDRAFT_45265 [Ascoidea rubescens DSM 1968]|uniref:Vacuolar protein sorting-associated protein 29 n=1 Tax=Ascoidea rubescens DSM 1968 TaxID=1344418 RepID=A0A1D2VKD4_9ASCO|nr:hypothetical protein ASCRUDRAFT_45265 [Ascoidea rubescens DSM 1968]ODV62059.1 hypothetical protein ASCRUDRAFT_45265 [Ascoidea rubescens DSM 1968]
MLILAIGDLHIPERAIDLPLKFKKLLTPGKIQQVLCLGNVISSITTLEFLKKISKDFQLVKGEYDIDNYNTGSSSVANNDQLRIGVLNGFNIVPQNDPLSLLIQARQMDCDILLWGGTHRVEAYTLDGKFFINPGSATGAYLTREIEDDDDYDDEDEDENDNDEDDEIDEERYKETQKNSKDGKNSAISNDKSKKDKTTFKESDSNSDIDSDSSESEFEDEDELIEPIPSFCLLDVQGSVCTLYIYTYIDDEVKVDKVTYRKE